MRSRRFPQVAIVDYAMGNLFSVKHACEHSGMMATITASREDLLAADAVILPGIGAFGDAMRALTELDLIGVIRDVAAAGTPLMGICLGLQLLMDASHEFGRHPGLGIIPGEVLPLREAIDPERVTKVPHVGWSAIHSSSAERGAAGCWEGTLLAGVAEGAFMYFVHSFFVCPVAADLVLTTTDYGGFTFCSALRRANVFGCQFHPERSGREGLRMYENLATLLTHERSKREHGREARREVRTA
jgi:glutamine amidotransferase